MNLGKDQMLLEEAAKALRVAKSQQKQQQQQQQQQQQSVIAPLPSEHTDQVTNGGAGTDIADDNDDDNASVGTHNTQGTQGSRRAFATDSSWIGRRSTSTNNNKAATISGRSMASSDEGRIPTSIKFGDMKKKVGGHKIQTTGSIEQVGVASSSKSNNSTGDCTDGSGSAGQGRPGKLKVPPAFLTGGSAGAGIISPLSAASLPPTNDNVDDTPSKTLAPAPSRKEAMLMERKKKMDAAIKVARPEPAQAPSTALAHADERRRLQEKRRKIRQKVKATQQLQHQRAMEAAERNRARTEILEVPLAASAESAAASSAPKLLSPASECSIECIFKDEVAPVTGSTEEMNIEPADKNDIGDNTDTDQQPTETKKLPTPPLPTKPLSVRPGPIPQPYPPTAGLPTAGVPFDEAAAVDPTSPPRVTRSPMSGVLRPTLDDADSSALPSLELSPIRRPQDASFEKSSEMNKADILKTNSGVFGDSPSLRGRDSADDEGPILPYASTPEKAQQGIIPASHDNTPKITNRAVGIQRSSSSGMLSHPVSVLPKDLPSGKPRKKPAGLPLSPTKASLASGASGTTLSNVEEQILLKSSKSSPTATSLGISLHSSEQARIGATSTTTHEPTGRLQGESVVSPANTIDTKTLSEPLQSTSGEGDSLLSWLGKQSDNETATSTPAEEEGLLKSVQNVEPRKKEPLSVTSGSRSTRSQSLDVISEGQSHHSSERSGRSPSPSPSPSSQQSKQQEQASVARPFPTQEAAIGSFISMISSAYNGFKIDNALDGVMEVVAEGVDKGYKEVSNITTSFLDGPVANAGTKQKKLQSQQAQNVHLTKGSGVQPKSPGMGPIQIEISRSFNPRIIAYDNDENATMDGSRVSALTFETYEDYISTTSLSPARPTSTTNRRTPRGLQMTYSEDASSHKDGTGGKKAGAATKVKEEQNWQPFEKERRFFA